MEQLTHLFRDMIESQQLIEGVLSNLRRKSIDYTKVKVKPVLLKGEIYYQFTYYTGTKVRHENLPWEETIPKLVALMEEIFKQGVFFTKEADIQVLVSKKQKVNILRKKPTKKEAELSHNRKKKYLIEEGTPVPFLVELGVMNKEGKVLSQKYDKYKQINRFLELIADIVPSLPKDRRLNIVDFGCGKSYLTFALYHYLKEVEQLDLNVIGLDLKEDVICHCNRLAEQLSFENLKFFVGDIAKYEGLEQVDMVVTLHACDTATDAALEKAVRWDAGVILSVPCCQHELFTQVKCETLSPMLEHGIIKERFSALATDSIRAKLLKILGYKVQVIEYIDMEHTPKNLMIRAVKQNKIANLEEEIRSYLEFKQFLQVNPYLEIVLQDRLEEIFTRTLPQ
jgi:SAM-dependent methyltransferase